MKPILLVFKFEESINTNTHKSWLHKIYFRFLPTDNKQRRKNNEIPRTFPCRVAWYYIYNARAHIAVLMGLYYVTFWLNRFLANNNNLAFFWAQFEKEKFNILFSCFLHNLSENLFISTQTDCDWYCATLLCCLENIPPIFSLTRTSVQSFMQPTFHWLSVQRYFRVWMMNAIPVLCKICFSKARWS